MSLNREISETNDNIFNKFRRCNVYLHKKRNILNFHIISINKFISDNHIRTIIDIIWVVNQIWHRLSILAFKTHMSETCVALLTQEWNLGILTRYFTRFEIERSHDWVKHIIGVIKYRHKGYLMKLWHCDGV